MPATLDVRSVWRAAKPCPETLVLLAIGVPIALGFAYTDLGAEYTAVVVALLIGVQQVLRERGSLGEE